MNKPIVCNEQTYLRCDAKQLLPNELLLLLLLHDFSIVWVIVAFHLHLDLEVVESNMEDGKKPECHFESVVVAYKAVDNCDAIDLLLLQQFLWRIVSRQDTSERQLHPDERHAHCDHKEDELIAPEAVPWNRDEDEHHPEIERAL